MGLAEPPASWTITANTRAGAWCAEAFCGQKCKHASCVDGLLDSIVACHVCDDGMLRFALCTPAPPAAQASPALDCRCGTSGSVEFIELPLPGSQLPDVSSSLARWEVHEGQSAAAV